jgi:hypothetical protein
MTNFPPSWPSCASLCRGARDWSRARLNGPFVEPRDNWIQIQFGFEWTSEGTDGLETMKLRPKSPDRFLVQTQDEARASEWKRSRRRRRDDAPRTNAAQKGRRQGTSLPVDNRGPDRCYASRLRLDLTQVFERLPRNGLFAWRTSYWRLSSSRLLRLDILLTQVNRATLRLIGRRKAEARRRGLPSVPTKKIWNRKRQSGRRPHPERAKVSSF